jgi:hypothetical protein
MLLANGLLGMMGLLSFVVGDCVDQAREGMIDVDSWALTLLFATVLLKKVWQTEPFLELSMIF